MWDTGPDLALISPRRVVVRTDPRPARREPVTEAFPGEAEVVERARTDAQAFGVLYEHYLPLIYRFVFNRVHDRAVAEDLTSEVFFKALRAIDRYQPMGKPFGAWLYQIANFTVIDHLRKHRPTLDLEAIVERPDGETPLDERVARRAEVRRVWDAVAGLAEAQRLAITLKLGQDMRTADIAACMGRSEGAVKLLIHRGLTNVRRQLQDAAPRRQEA